MSRNPWTDAWRRTGLRRRGLARVFCAAAGLLCADAGPARSEMTREVAGYFLPAGAEHTYDNSFASLAHNCDVITQIAPVFYRLAANGTDIEYQAGITDAIVEETLRAGRECAVKIIPVTQNWNPDIPNATNPSIMGDFDSAALRTLVSSPARRAEHVRQAVTLVSAWGFDGIEIDYEQMGVDIGEGAPYEDDFTALIGEFSAAVHAEGKLLAIAVHPKFKDEATWGGPEAQDYAALHPLVDMFRVMTYDFSWSISAPGAISPVRFMRDVITYIVKTGSYTNHRGEFSNAGGASYRCLGLDPAKVYLGVPFYGYDWYEWDPGLYVGDPDHDPWWGNGVAQAYPFGSEMNRGRSDPRVWEETRDLIAAHAIVPARDVPDREIHKFYWGDYGNMFFANPEYGFAAGARDYIGPVGYFVYPDSTGTAHYGWPGDPFAAMAGAPVRKVYFEDHQTLEPKLDLVGEFDLGGIAIWRLGGEDPQNFDLIWERFADGPRVPPTWLRIEGLELAAQLQLRIAFTVDPPVASVGLGLEAAAAPAGDWSVVEGAELTGDSGRYEYSCPVSAAAAVRFYRVVYRQP